jgi:hypothetical protein
LLRSVLAQYPREKAGKDPATFGTLGIPRALRNDNFNINDDLKILKRLALQEMAKSFPQGLKAIVYANDADLKVGSFT